MPQLEIVGELRELSIDFHEQLLRLVMKATEVEHELLKMKHDSRTVALKLVESLHRARDHAEELRMLLEKR